MKHIIEGIEVNIDWQQVEKIESHGSGCVDWIVSGEDENDVTYFGYGNYQDDELSDVTEIESIIPEDHNIPCPKCKSENFAVMSNQGFGVYKIQCCDCSHKGSINLS